MGVKYEIPEENQFERKYHLIRFYPKKSSYEFINIGIVLYEENDLVYKMMKQEHISKISAHSFLDIRVLSNAIKNIKILLNKRLSQIELISHLNNRYKNSLDTSFVLSHLGNETIEDLIELLYFEYIGYRFPNKKQSDKVVETRTITYEIFKKRYRKFLPVIKDENFDLSYKKNDKTTNIIIGSLDRQDSLDKVLRMTPVINPLYKINDNFNFGYINDNIDKENIKLENRLHMLKNAKFKPVDFTKKDNINIFFENEIKELK